MAKDTPSLDHPMFLQRTVDRDRLVERFLDDLTESSDEYPSEPVEQPVWGVIYNVGAHLAVKHPSNQDFFRGAGEPDYNIYRIPYADLVELLKHYDDLVLKTASYTGVTEKDIRFEAFDHQLNDRYLPDSAEEVSFITGEWDSEQFLLVEIEAGSPGGVDNGELQSLAAEAHPVEELPRLLGDATSLHLLDSTVIPDNLNTGIERLITANH